MTLLKYFQWNVRMKAKLKWLMEGEEMEASNKEYVFKNFGTWGKDCSVTGASREAGSREHCWVFPHYI